MTTGLVSQSPPPVAYCMCVGDDDGGAKGGFKTVTRRGGTYLTLGEAVAKKWLGSQRERKQAGRAAQFEHANTFLELIDNSDDGSGADVAEINERQTGADCKTATPPHGPGFLGVRGTERQTGADCATAAPQPGISGVIAEARQPLENPKLSARHPVTDNGFPDRATAVKARVRRARAPRMVRPLAAVPDIEDDEDDEGMLTSLSAARDSPGVKPTKYDWLQISLAGEKIP